MSEWPTYYGPDGEPIESTEEWAALLEARREDLSNDSWWRRRTQISDDVEVSSVWLGLNHNWGPGAPLIWETMIFGGGYNEHQWRYPSRQTCLDDHERIVRALREGRDPEED